MALEPTLLLPPRPAGKGAEDRRQGHCCGTPHSRGPRPVTAEGSHGYNRDQRGGQAQTCSPRLLPERAVWAWSRPGTPFLRRAKTRVEVTGSGCPGPGRTRAVRTFGSSRGQLLRPGRDGLSPQTGSIWASRHMRSTQPSPQPWKHSPSLPGPSSPGCTAGVGEGGDGRGWGDGVGGSHLLRTAPHPQLACSSYIVTIYGVQTLSSASSVFLFYFWLHREARGILVPRPGIGPTPPALKAPSPIHWTARKSLDVTLILRTHGSSER